MTIEHDFRPRDEHGHLIEPVVLPKQLRHWLQKAGFYPDARYGLHRRWKRNNFIFASSKRSVYHPNRLDYPVDDSRYIRFLPHLDRVDICDGYFDRWANSLAASYSPIPQTKVEFDQMLARLLYDSQRNITARIREDAA